MNARLFCKTGQFAGTSFEIRDEATIGKNAENTIQLHPALVSGKHARIYFDEKTKSYFLEDLNSRNGTRLDGVRVKGKERLGRLHVITFANVFDFLFQLTASPKPFAPPTPKVEEPKTQIGQDFVPLPEIKLEADTKQKTVYDDGAFVLPPMKGEKGEEQQTAESQSEAPRTQIGVEFTPVPSFVQPSEPPKSAQIKSNSLPNYVLVFEMLRGGPRTFDVREGSTIVGREASCTISVDDASLSRQHAELVLRGSRLTLRDLGSKNHTYIDNQEISSEVEVKEGMEIAFGVLTAKLIRKSTE